MPQITLTNKQTGESRPVDTDSAEFSQLARSGQFTSGDSVNIRTRDGELASVPFDQIGNVLSRGGSLASAADETQLGVDAARKEEFKDQFAATAGRNLLRAGTGGLSALLENPREARGLDEFNPGAAAVGTGLGIGLGVLTGGGIGATFGSAARGGIAGLSVRAAGNLGARVGSRFGRTAGLAAEGALEGMLFEAGQVVSDVALSDEPINWQSTLARIPTAGLLGAGIGGALGGGLKLAGKLSKPSQTLNVSADVFSQAAKRSNADALATVNSQAAIANRAQQLRNQAVDTFEAGVKRVEEPAIPLDKTGAASPKAKAGRGAAPKPFTPKQPPMRIALESADQAAADLTKLGAKLKKASKGIDKLNIDKFSRKIATDAAADVKKLDEYIGVLDEIDQAAGSNLVQKFIDDQGLVKFKSIDPDRLDDVIKKLPKAQTEGGELLRRAYGAGHLVTRASAKKALQQEIGGVLKEMAIGGIAGSMLGFGPLAAAGGALFGKHTIGTVLRAAAGTSAVKDSLRKTAAKFLKGAAKPKARRSAVALLSGVRLGEKSKEKDPVKARILEIEASTSDPGLPDRIDAALSPITAHNPNYAFRVADAALARLEFYRAKAPLPPPDNPFVKQKWNPDPVKVSEFARAVFAGENPLQAMEEMLESKRVDSVMLETIETLYPELLVQLQNEILEQYAEKPRNFDYQERLFLGRLTGTPIEPSAQPEFVSAMQMMYAAKAQEQPAQQIDGVPSKAQPTKAQRLEAR